MPADILLIQRRLVSIMASVGAIADQVETIEEIRRLPTTAKKDRRAIAEAASEARDTCMQLEVSATELFSHLNQIAKEHS